MFKQPEPPISSNDIKTVSVECNNSLEEADTRCMLENSKICGNASKCGTVMLPIPYNEPSWGALPNAFYSLEELKSGVSLRTIPLDSRSFYCFGRLDNCHIVMAHPSISRYHAIIQFRSTFSPTDEKRGFYVFDLGSTHGTFINRERIQPKTFIKLQVGHIIKFGSSTRMFLLQGPDDDREEESQYSYSQMRETRKKQLEEREKAYLEEKARLCKEQEHGIDWGMGEDADEETDLTENPFAITTNEELYIDDPKKTLRGWFDREGEELVYNVEEKGFGHFHCTIELPIESSNGATVTAEATVSGKKKEAVHQCALEACRILDRNGLLRQSTHESKQRKRKNWEDDDFYDSDEDNFFDRTGELEVKRKHRMLQSNKEQAIVDNYDTLVIKHTNILQEIKQLEQKLESICFPAIKSSNLHISDVDTVDTYMSNVICQQPVDRIEQKKMKSQLNNLRNEEERLRRLVNFTKPHNLPEINPFDSRQEKKMSIADNENHSMPITTDKSEGINSSLDNIFKVPEIKLLKSKQAEKQSIADDENHFTPTINYKSDEKNSSSDNIFKIPDVNLCKKKMKDVNNKNAKKDLSQTYMHQEEQNSVENNEKNNINLTPVIDQNMHSEHYNAAKVEPVGKKSSLSNKTKIETSSEDYNNLIWVPPADQTGDGRTSLNDKLGY